MNRLLSMRPLKMGTPFSRHFKSTSLRAKPASRASSVGVRWLAIGESSYRCGSPACTYTPVGGHNQQEIHRKVGIGVRVNGPPRASEHDVYRRSGELDRIGYVDE